MECDLTNRTKTIEDYLSEQLSVEEQKAFDEHLFNCDICFQELNFKEKVVNLVRDEGNILFKKYLKKKKKKDEGFFQIVADKFPTIIRNKQKRWIFASVTVCILMISIILIFKPFTPHSGSDELFKIEPFPYLKPHTLEDLMAAEKKFFEGMEYYQRDEFAEAGLKLQEALAENQQLVEAYFYLGVCYFFQDQSDQAIINLKIAIEQKPNSEKAYWFLGHLYYKMGETQNAITEFQKVADLGQKRYSLKAKKIINSLTRDRKER